MRQIIIVASLVLAGLFLRPTAIAAQNTPAFKIIVHTKNPVSSMSRAELGKIFLKKTTSWAGEGAIQPVDQLVPVERPGAVAGQRHVPLHAVVNDGHLTGRPARRRQRRRRRQATRRGRQRAQIRERIRLGPEGRHGELRPLGVEARRLRRNAHGGVRARPGPRGGGAGGQGRQAAGRGRPRLANRYEVRAGLTFDL